MIRLNRLYPEITKSKIRAALTLCEGDTIESIRLLNACMKKIHLKNLSSPSCNAAIGVEDIDDRVYLQADVNQNSIRIYNGSVERNSPVAPLGSFPNSSGIAPISTMCTISDSATSSDRRSTVTADESVTSEVDGVYFY